MAYSLEERASIEAQVCLKGAVELTAAQAAAGVLDPNEDIYDTLDLTAKVLANVLVDVKGILGAGKVQTVQPQVPQAQDPDVEAAAIAKIQTVFPEATVEPTVTPIKSKSSRWLDDEEYPLVHKLWLVESARGIAYGSKDSMFMCNQAIRKLYEKGHRQFPADYFVETMRGQDIPVTQKGKCALGDFKLKRILSVDAEGNTVLGAGEGNHPLAGKSGYFFGMQKHTPFNWGERPDPIDPLGWLVNA
jgi:hypothetical protein